VTLAVLLDSDSGDNDNSRGDGTPAENGPAEPIGLRGDWLGDRLDRRQSQRQDIAAFCATGNVLQYGGTFLRRERTLGEGRQHIWVGMTHRGHRGLHALANEFWEMQHLPLLAVSF